MTFLELCQMVARESGTISGTQPATVEAQTGRLANVVEWVRDAWSDIQNSRSTWRWMIDTFEADTVAETSNYSATDLGITRFGSWQNTADGVTCYLKSMGVADERVVVPISWSDYRRQYNVGSQVSSRPIWYSISHSEEFCLGPTPDTVYVVRGEYRKSPQTLTLDDDVPELPARFHRIIAWKALICLAEHDEAQLNLATYNARYRSMLHELERDQLPKIHIGAGSLA